MNERYPNAAPPRDGDAISRFERIDRSLSDMAAQGGAASMQYPSLISRKALERAEYPKAFPHLLMAAAALQHPEAISLEPANLRSPDWCLSPAVCYHVYADLSGKTLDTPKIMTARGRCFRHEARIDPGRRQIEFEMREIVLLGSSQWIADTVPSWKDQLDELLRDLALAGTWQVAEDPFFLPSAKGQALMQRLMETKLEYCSNGPDPIALASINRHGDFLASGFPSVMAVGSSFIPRALPLAWTGCAHRRLSHVTFDVGSQSHRLRGARSIVSGDATSQTSVHTGSTV